eukprot:TRINITY_DN15305_c3_g1_i1.p1 TRINITY_DN15305_c3_g1~~TRINITY_DN15305_c3_g1_i1.p1  ORF type:complete len:380 (+),score=38.68 TRINITY_DN15305_c3_g1_i1:40-1179(+)
MSRVLRISRILMNGKAGTRRYCSSQAAERYVYHDRTLESLQWEIEDIYSGGSPMALSIGVLSASMLGDVELYVRCMAKLFALLGTDLLSEIDHNTWTSKEIAECSLACYKKLKQAEALDIRLWLLARACVAAEYMEDLSLAEGCRQVVMHALDTKDKDSFTAPEAWALGYVLHHMASRHANSENQINHSPGGNQKPKDAFGVNSVILTHISKNLRGEPGDIIWCRIMLLHAASASKSKEHWSRYSWTTEYFDQLPLSDYRAWALALIAHSAANTGYYDEAVQHVNKAMDIIKSVPPSERAPHEDLITILTLRTAFIDMHRLEPRRTKKLARTSLPYLPFVTRGQVPRLLGNERHLFFKKRVEEAVFVNPIGSGLHLTSA